VTKEELEQIMAETLRRAKQSDKDRAKQIDEKLNAITTRLQSGGNQLTPQQVNVLREQIEEEVHVEPKAEAQASAVPPEVQAQTDFVYAQMDATFADVGTVVTPNDPEWTEINAVLNDPNGSLAKLIRVSARQAEAKAVRETAQKTQAAARVVGNTGGGTSNPNNISNINDSAALYAMGEERLKNKTLK
jgi:hypothetical protein